ncbi:MAG: porin family protein [Fimbriimonadaceae bacterium]|nr:porin family protein [Fimbriimonadaceae bacterium]
MDFKLRTAMLVGLLAATTASFADDNAKKAEDPRVDRPFKFTIGFHVPTINQNDNDASSDTGFTGSVGWSFIRTQQAGFELEARYTAYKLKFLGDRETISMGTFFLNGYGRFGQTTRDGSMTWTPCFFAGGGIGVGTGRATIQGVEFGKKGGSLVWQAFLGYEFTEHVFAQVRYQGGQEDIHRGWGLEIGFRF